MNYKRFLLIAVTTLITTSLQSAVVLPGILPVQQVLAQATEAHQAEADRLLKQGIQQHQKSQFQAALQSWEQALQIYREIKNLAGEGAALGNLGIVYGSLGDYKKAIEFYQQCLAIAKEIKDSQLETLAQKLLASAQISKGIQQHKKGQFQDALQSWEQALQIYRKIKGRAGEGRALGNLGVAYRSLGDYNKAIDYHQQSLAIAKKIGNKAGEGRALGNLGIAYNSLGEYKKAIDYHQKYLAIAKQIGNKAGISHALGNLGIAYASLGDYEKAIEYHQQHLAIAKQIGNKAGEGRALGNLGVAYRSLGEYKKAIDYYQQSLVIFKKIGDKAGEGAALGSLGNAYSSLGDYKKAIDYYQQRLAIAKKIGDKAGEGAALGNLGVAYRSLGDYKEAIDYHQKYLAIAKKIGDKAGEGRALGNLGNTYYSLGDYKKAIDYHQQHLAIAKQIEDKAGEGRALGNLGNAYRSLGDYNKAIDYHQQRLAIAKQIGDKEGEGGALGNLGLAYGSLGDYKKAIDYHQQSLVTFQQIGDKAGEGRVLGNLGNAYRSLGDYKKAIDYHQQHLAIAKQIGNKAGEGGALNNLGLAYYKQRKFTLAENTLSEGIKVWESLRNSEFKDSEKVSFFDTQRSTYGILQLVLIAQNKTDAALEISERGRARAFVELIVSRNKQLDKSPVPPTITQIKQIAKAQNATLVQYSIIYDEFKIAGKPQVKQSEIYIWVIKPTGEIAFKKVDLKSLKIPLKELVSITRNSMGVRDGQFSAIVKKPIANPKLQTEKLQKLHQLLIKPIAQLLPKDDDSRVILIPHQDLFLAPFPALMDADGKYLIEKHTILTAPSIQVLALTNEQRQKLANKSGEYLIVGNPSPMPPGFQPLSGAEKEAKAIAKLLNVKPLIGSQATESKITKKLPSAKLIHLATHGTFNEVQPRESGIALAPGGGSDGMLTAGEIFDSKMKLKAELVVLSACDTGRGRITGDGVIGLSRSLISAGVPSVLISLWQVPDAATAELMTEFYTNIYERKLDKAQGLRQAMLKVMKKHPNYPKAWAAFTLVGEAE